ncbi:MAG: kelch repeat-containing protein, partial [Thermoplasmata archaeon]
SIPQGFLAFGGKNGNLFFNDTWVFTNGAWIRKEGANAPSPRAFSAIGYSSDGTLYLFGGRNETTVFGDLWAYNISADTWSKITFASGPGQRYWATLTYHGSSGKLLLFGGNSSTQLLNDLWEFNPQTKTWVNRNPGSPPAPRFFHAVAYAEVTSKLYLFGGLGATGALSDFHEYNYTGNGWRTLTTTPQSRYGHALGYLSGNLILTGGTDGTSTFGDTWRYTISTNSWQQLSPSSPLFPVAFPGFASSNSQILLLGGFNGGEYPLNQFFPSYTAGTFTTQSVDTQGQGTTNFYLRWNPPVQEHGVLKCQVALNNDNTTWNFVGPDGTSGTYYENGYGQPVSGSGRYVKVRVYFLPENGILSPWLDSLTISFSRPPGKPIAKTPSGILQNSTLTFTWEFNATDTDYQTAFRIQVSQNPSFNPVFLDTGVIQSSAQLWIYSSIPDGAFYWRVATRDSEGLWSDYSEPLQFTVDTVPPSGTITINSGAQYTNTAGVSLALTYTDTGTGVSRMCFSNDGVAWSAWEPPVPQKNWNLEAGDGTKYVYMKLLDNAGNVFICGDTIVLDTVPPMCSVTINNNTDYTNTENVWLQVSATDATSGIDAVRFSNDGNTWSNWQAISENIPFTLTSGDGLKRVYAQVRDRSGLTAIASDTIYLDKSPPPTPSFIPEPAYTPGYTNTVSWYPVSDALAGGVSYNVECSSTPAFSWVASSGWIYTTSYTFSGLTEGYTYYYRVRARDALGNIGPYSAPVSSTQDATGPTITQTLPHPPAYFHPENILLSWKAVDYISGLSGRYHIQISQDQNFVLCSVDSYISGSTGNLDTIYHAPSLPDGRYYWRVQAEDNAGNWGQYSEILSFEVDSTAPRIVCNRYVYGWYSTSPGSVIDVDFFATGNSPLTLARWRKTNGEWHTIFQGAFSGYTQNWAVAWDEMEEGNNQVFIEVFDGAGNRAEGVIYFLKDTGLPDATVSLDGVLGTGGWYVSVVSAEIAGTDSVSGIATIIYRIFDGVLWTPEQEYTAPLKFNRTGIYTLEFYTLDNAGNSCERHTIEIRVDLQSPVSWCDAGSGWYSQLPVVINLSTQDLGSGVLGIYYSVDGGSYTFQNNQTVELKIEGEGFHRITFFGVDVAGNREIEKSVVVRVDATPPATGLSWCRENASATIFLNSTDGISGVSQSFFWVFNNSTGTPVLEISGGYEGPFNLSEGIWLIQFYAIDQAGNQEECKNCTLILDWHEPSIEIYLNENATTTNTTRVRISINATDNVGLTAIAFSEDGYNWTAMEGLCTEKEWMLEEVEGWHTIYCKVVDIAGNINITRKSIYLDFKTPVLYGFTVKPLLGGNTSVLLKWYVSEPVRAKLSFSVDGEGFEVIAENITTTELPWTVPAVNSETCVVLLEVWDGANNYASIYSNFFRIDSLQPDVESFSPELAEPVTWIEIRFTEEMDKESVERSFVIQPYVAGKFYWVDNRTLIFVPEGKLEEGATYRVIIRDEAKDLAGNSMAQRVFYMSIKSYLLYYILILLIVAALVASGVYLYLRKRKKRKMSARMF